MIPFLIGFLASHYIFGAPVYFAIIAGLILRLMCLADEQRG